MVEGSEKKRLSVWLEEFNINRTDIIIYSIGLGILIILIIMFILISNDLQNKVKETQSITKRYEKALTLKSEANEIRLEHCTLPEVCENLLSKFVAQNEMSDFLEYVKTVATTFKGKEISASRTAMTSFEEKIFSISDEVADFFVEKGVFKENDFIQTRKGRSIKVVFTKQSLRIDMGMSLGNLLAFLYCLENSSKYIDVTSLNLSGGESELVRVSMTVNGYQLSNNLVSRINVILSGTPIAVLKNNIKKILDKSDLSDEQLKSEIKNILNSSLTPESEGLKNDINKILSDTSLVSVSLKNKINEVLSKTRKGSEIKVLKSFPKISRVIEKRVLKEEIIKYDNNIEQRVRPILSVPVPPPPPPPPKPENIKVLSIVADVVAIDVNGRTYFAWVGGKEPFKTNKKEPIPGFENLKIIEKNDNRKILILNNNGVTSDIPFKK